MCVCVCVFATHKIFEKSFSSNLSSEVCVFWCSPYTKFDSIPYFHGHKSHLFIHSCMLECEEQQPHLYIHRHTKIMYYNNNNGCFTFCVRTTYVCMYVTPFKTVVGKIVSRKFFTITFISIYFPCAMRCLLLNI